VRVLEHTASRLVLRERPWLAWLVGGLLAAAGAGVALLGGEPTFGGLFVAVGLVAGLVGGRTITCTFDTATGQLTRESVGPLGHATVQCPLADVRAVRVVRGLSRSQTYRVELVLADAEFLPLTTSYSSGKGQQEAIARLVRAFLGLPEVGELDLPGLGDLVGMLRPPTR
jgi:crotonobetainyl-CoA:carnitine CoA-transferase CaiB-like acyl-CoA transferase